MTLKQIAALGRKLVVFLSLFADCFGRSAMRRKDPPTRWRSRRQIAAPADD